MLLTSTKTTTITNGTALSGAVALGEQVLVGIQMSAAWTSASLSFQISIDGGTTWLDLYDDSGTEVTLSPTSPAGKFLAISPDPFAGAVFLKVRSGTTGTPVNQGADRVLTLLTRKLFAVG